MLIDVTAACAAVMSTVRDFGMEQLPFTAVTGRILREPVLSDRDFPPYDRVMMDGIAIDFESYEKGQTVFGVEDMQAAGMPRKQLGNVANCMEVMTGAIMPELTDTVIQYEHLTATEHEGFKRFTINAAVEKGQHIHRQGSDAAAGQLVIPAGTLLTAAEVGVLASVGKTLVNVSRLPKIAIIATGDELVPVADTPDIHQVRISNSYSLAAALQELGIEATCYHVADNEAAIQELFQSLKQMDAWICTGAVSAGKYDYLPHVLEQMGMQQLFHKVQQRPGKPFLFGQFENGPVVFALPGNPVSGFMCCYRYVLPWLRACLQYTAPPMPHAVLGIDVNFAPPLTYFMPVKLHPVAGGQLIALPPPYHGSGDLAALLQADAFIELPAEQSAFAKGSSYPVWRFRQ
ncbi:molybdopterin molybdotransferase MoeA [Chitinophaga rhizophila]|uniref:Molybdopterin molybdenumtransferase n=1 Tax=Chitinophaga rhizophila TaxID=2866212 RepID=A0ABS7GD76_9BACT|nr:molybdopterin molybdotransferase MoeA [Chitinophaga rhizophila]MBW8685629.1 molybdopterin molybdotransferase MoeA [Chitinophaga rhizophila]